LYIGEWKTSFEVITMSKTSPFNSL